MQVFSYLKHKTQRKPNITQSDQMTIWLNIKYCTVLLQDFKQMVFKEKLPDTNKQIISSLFDKHYTHFIRPIIFKEKSTVIFEIRCLCLECTYILYFINIATIFFLTEIRLEKNKIKKFASRVWYISIKICFVWF